jgi:hypothetical protein
VRRGVEGGILPRDLLPAYQGGKLRERVVNAPARDQRYELAEIHAGSRVAAFKDLANTGRVLTVAGNYRQGG